MGYSLRAFIAFHAGHYRAPLREGMRPEEALRATVRVRPRVRDENGSAIHGRRQVRAAINWTRRTNEVR
jgi:hypothetical protein